MTAQEALFKVFSDNHEGQAVTILGQPYLTGYHVSVSAAKLITEYELIDHGIEGSQYFQGCGTATSFDVCSTGCGSNPAEAISDAIDGLADEYDVESLEAFILEDEGWSELPESPDAHVDCHECEEGDCEECVEHDGCELYYYVSIRVR